MDCLPLGSLGHLGLSGALDFRSLHAQPPALVQATLFAAFPIARDDGAVVGLVARVLLLPDDGPPEEALTALAGQDVVVPAGRLVFTHLA